MHDRQGLGGRAPARRRQEIDASRDQKWTREREADLRRGPRRRSGEHGQEISDNLGRDILTDVIHGARVSLVVGLLAAASSTFIGTTIGSIAGFFGGAADAFLMRTTEFFQIVPRFFLALIIIALSGPGVGKVIFVIAILGWPAAARLVRGEFLRLRSYEFVEAARAMGVSSATIIVQEILPNAVAPAIVAGSLDVAQAILLEAGLSFFGLGDPNHIS